MEGKLSFIENKIKYVFLQGIPIYPSIILYVTDVEHL